MAAESGPGGRWDRAPAAAGLGRMQKKEDGQMTIEQLIEKVKKLKIKQIIGIIAAIYLIRLLFGSTILGNQEFKAASIILLFLDYILLIKQHKPQ